MKLTGLLDQVSICFDNIRSLFNSGWLGFNNGERIAFAIVLVEVRYPDRIVGIALLL
jgi:hypothetical protein